MLESINATVANQIREMRSARGMSQAELAEALDTGQGWVSRAEDPEYGRYSLRSLRRIAEVMDVALIVRFAPYSELAEWFADLSPSKLEVPAFDSDSLVSPPEDIRESIRRGEMIRLFESSSNNTFEGSSSGASSRALIHSERNQTSGGKLEPKTNVGATVTIAMRGQ